MNFAPEQPGVPCRDSEHPKCPHPRAPHSITLQCCMMPRAQLLMAALLPAGSYVLDFGVSAAFGDCRAARVLSMQLDAGRFPYGPSHC